MAMGRWSTIAWERYSVASLKDLQGAAERMWAEAEKRANSGCRVVGSVDTAGIFAEDHALGTSISQAAQANTGVTIRCSTPALTSEVVYPSSLQVGSTTQTKWGNATVVSICEDGDLECSWSDWSGVYKLSGPTQ